MATSTSGVSGSTGGFTGGFSGGFTSGTGTAMPDGGTPDGGTSDGGLTGGMAEGGLAEGGVIDSGLADAGPDVADAEPPVMGTGECCADGNCLCHGPDPRELTSRNGPFRVRDYRISTGTVYYPTNAEPPFAAVALCGGFLNTGPEMNDWGSFYASHGIVTVIVSTGGADLPATRGRKLLAAVEELKGENQESDSPLFGNLSGRYGTSGYSMGGGGTTIASGDDPSLLTSVGLAAWAPEGRDVQVPTLLLCGTSDTTAPCGGSGGSVGAYGNIPESTPKMMIQIRGATHLGSWFAPRDGGRGGISGQFALAFQKVYLEGDERWQSLLATEPADGSEKTTNIQ